MSDSAIVFVDLDKLSRWILEIHGPRSPMLKELTDGRENGVLPWDKFEPLPKPEKTHFCDDDILVWKKKCIGGTIYGSCLDKDCADLPSEPLEPCRCKCHKEAAHDARKA